VNQSFLKKSLDNKETWGLFVNSLTFLARENMRLVQETLFMERQKTGFN
jgi:hypothetical protein